MKKEDIFTTVQLHDARKVQILNITPLMSWRAMFSHALSGRKDIDVLPFLLTQLIRVEGQEISVNELGEMYFDDYVLIVETANALLQKVKF
jgi:hypothetical protein